MGGVIGGWSGLGASSLKKMGVRIRSSVAFRQTDSWSNRLRRAVGSLGSDLSPLDPLHSSYGRHIQNCFHSIVAVVAGGALLTVRQSREIRKPLTFHAPPFAKVCLSLYVLL